MSALKHMRKTQTWVAWPSYTFIGGQRVNLASALFTSPSKRHRCRKNHAGKAASTSLPGRFAVEAFDENPFSPTSTATGSLRLSDADLLPVNPLSPAAGHHRTPQTEIAALRLFLCQRSAFRPPDPPGQVDHVQRLYETLSETIARQSCGLSARGDRHPDGPHCHAGSPLRAADGSRLHRSTASGLRNALRLLQRDAAPDPRHRRTGFRAQCRDLEEVENRIRAALQGIRQPRLLTLAQETPPHFTWNLPPMPHEPTTEANWQALGDFIALTKAWERSAGPRQPSARPPREPRSAAERAAGDNASAAALAQRTAFHCR